MSTLDSFDIGKNAALVVVSAKGVTLLPGVITGTRTIKRYTGYRRDGAPDEVSMLWTDGGGTEQDVNPSRIMLLEHELPPEINAILWPSEPATAPPVSPPAPPTATDDDDGVAF